MAGLDLPEDRGVYEVRHAYEQARLTIGKPSNLRMRAKQGLVKGKTPHSAGKRIRATEDTSTTVIRWAQTDRPAAVEEEHHRLHIELLGALPEHTLRT